MTPSPRRTEYAFAVQELVLANHILAQKGIVDAYGHVSIRHPTNPHRYLMSRSIAPAQVGGQQGHALGGGDQRNAGGVTIEEMGRRR